MNDLQDCYESMMDNDLSLPEREARIKLVKLCKAMTEDFGEITNERNSRLGADNALSVLR